MKTHLTYLFFMMLACGFSACSHNGKDKNPENETAKRQHYHLVSTGQRYRFSIKEALLEKAYTAISPLPEDTVKAKHLVKLSFRYYDTKDTTNIQKGKQRGHTPYKKLKDSLGLALTYWDLGDFFSDKLYKRIAATIIIPKRSSFTKRQE